MKKYNMAGKLKNQEEQEHDCKTCNNGNIWNDKKYYLEGNYDSIYQTPACGVCLSTYKIKKSVPIIENLTFFNTELLFKNIMEKIMEAKKVDVLTLAQREHYAETGQCPEHQWISSKPVNTPEGKFVFDSCLICKWARVKYKNKIYEADLMSLINWISKKGMEYEKSFNENLKDLGRAEKKIIGISNLFSDSFIKTPSQELEEMFK